MKAQRTQRPPFVTKSRLLLAVWIEYLLYLIAGEGTWLHRCCLGEDSPLHGQFCFWGVFWVIEAVFSPQVFMRWLGGLLAGLYFWWAAQSYSRARRQRHSDKGRPESAA